MVYKLWGFKVINPSKGMLLATSNAAKFVQICPKTISLGNFEIPPKIEILMFFKKLKTYV
jgi:hypothetical protein